MHLIRSMAVVSLSAALLVGCGAESDTPAKEKPEVAQPSPGQCIAKEIKDGNDTAPDFTSVVPCTEPHVYEVMGSVQVPEKYLDNSSPEASLKRRTELALVGDKAVPERKQVITSVNAPCNQTLVTQTGMDRLEVAGWPASGERILPAFGPRVDQWTTLTPPELWKDGNTKVVCSIRFNDGTEDENPEPVTSPTDKPLLSTFLRSDSEPWLHGCLQTGNKNVVGCDEAHFGERVWALHVNKVLRKSVLDGGLTDQESGEINHTCAEIYTSLGKKLPKDRAMVFSSTENQRKQGWVTCTIIKNGQTTKNVMKPGFTAF